MDKVVIRMSTKCSEMNTATSSCRILQSKSDRNIPAVCSFRDFVNETFLKVFKHSVQLDFLVMNCSKSNIKIPIPFFKCNRGHG